MNDTLDPRLTEPHLSNRFLRGFLIYLREQFGAEQVDRVVQEAGLPRSYLDDPDRWVSALYEKRVHDAALRLLFGKDQEPAYEDPVWNHWFEAGKVNLRPEVVGALYSMIRAIGSTDAAYQAMPRLQRRGRRTIDIRLLGHSRGSAILEVSPKPGFEAAWSPANCWKMRGLLTGGPRIWDLPDARLDHPECVFSAVRPASSCVYHVTYPVKASPGRYLHLLWPLAGAALGWQLAASLDLDGPWLGALVGALAVWTAERSWTLWRVREEAARETRTLVRLLETLDDKNAQLWRDDQALRKALLTAQKLANYLPPHLVASYMRNPEMDLALGGQRTEGGVVFADVVAFTPRCAAMSPEQVVEDLNVLFGAIDPAFARHDGIIDKRIGDCVMGVFIPRPGLAPPKARALACALDVLQALKACNDALRARGAPPFQLRVGVAAGELVQGNMGSQLKVEYTVIGDTVNLAARLEGVASPGRVMVPQDLLAELSVPAGVRVHPPRLLQVKGFSRPVEVVELEPLPEATPGAVPRDRATRA